MRDMTTAEHIKAVISDIEQLLLEKNRKYGDSALRPVRIFSNATPVEQILVRIDDKLSRISQGHGWDEEEDTITDLIGYLVLLQVALRCQDHQSPVESSGSLQ